MSSEMTKRVEYLLWIAGAFCLVFWIFMKTQAAFAQSNALRNIESLIDMKALDFPDRALWSSHRVEEFRALQDAESPAQALAILEIPGFDLRVAVFNGTEDDVLNLGVGRVSGTAHIGEIGNLALAGHRDGYFRPLKDIAIGDSIIVRHVDGIEEYVVSDLLIVNPENVSVLAPTISSRLTLVTCYPFYFVGNAPKRFIVVADRLTT